LSQARHFQPLLIQRQWLVTQTLLQRLICMLLLFERIVGMSMPFVNPNITRCNRSAENSKAIANYVIKDWLMHA
jgi:hypothetical protein